MDNKQKKALKELEESFKRCAKVGLIFFGLDCDLHVAPKGKYWKTENRKTKRNEYNALTDHQDYDKIVNTYATYTDSGGA